MEACNLLCPLGSHEAPKIYPVDAGPDGEVNEFDATSDAFVVAVLDDELELFLWLQRLLVKDQLPQLEAALTRDQRTL